jgi:hypothetical protein
VANIKTIILGLAGALALLSPVGCAPIPFQYAGARGGVTLGQGWGYPPPATALPASQNPDLAPQQPQLSDAEYARQSEINRHEIERAEAEQAHQGDHAMDDWQQNVVQICKTWTGNAGLTALATDSFAEAGMLGSHYRIVSATALEPIRSPITQMHCRARFTAADGAVYPMIVTFGGDRMYFTPDFGR